MATAPKDSTQIPAWKGASLLEPCAADIKAEEVLQSDPERPKDNNSPAAPVQASLPRVVSSTSEEMAAHSTALNRLFRAAADLEVAERDERDALAKAAALTAVKQQCMQARDDAKRALAAAGRSCRLAAEAHHAELLRQLALSTASLAASLAATSDDGDLGATSLDAAAPASSSLAAASAPTSTPATTAIFAATSATGSAARSSAALPLSGAATSHPPSPSPPTGTSTNRISIVEASAASTLPIAATPPAEVEGLTRIEATDLPFLNASVEDVRQADGLDRLATEDISFAATRVLRFCSARESRAITIATVIDRASTNTSGGFPCAVNKLVTALRRFHANAEHSWFPALSPAAAPGMLAPFPSARVTSFSSSSSPSRSGAPVVTATVDPSAIRSPQRVHPTSTSGYHRTSSSISNVNNFSDDNTVSSAAYVHRRRRRDELSHPRRPADPADTTPSSSSGRPRDDDHPHRDTATLGVSGSSRRHFSDIDSTTATVSIASAPWGRHGGSVGGARFRRDDSRDRLHRGNARDRLRRDGSRDRLRRDTSTRDRPRGDSNWGHPHPNDESDRPRGDSSRDWPHPDDARERSRGADHRGQPRQDDGRDRPRADNNRGQPLNGNFRGRPRDGSSRNGPRPGDMGERPHGDGNMRQPRQNGDRGRPRADNNRGQLRRDDSRDRPRSDNNDDRSCANNSDRPRANIDDRLRANNDGRPRANNDDRPRANSDDRPRANHDDRLRANTDDRPRDNNDDRPRANNNNRDRPRGHSRDRHQQLGGCTNVVGDRHPNLKTDDDGNCVGKRGRRGHRWGVKSMAPAFGCASDFAFGFASDSASGSASTTLSNSKRPTSPSRPASTRPPQRPRCRVAEYLLSSSSDGFDVAVSPPTLLSNAAAAVAAPPDGTARPLVSSTTAVAQPATINIAAADVLETASVHAVEQASVGISMR